MPRVAKSEVSSPIGFISEEQMEQPSVTDNNVDNQQKQDAAPTRRRKNVFNGTQLKLEVQRQIPGYHLHVFTDTGNRIYEAQDDGYEFVSPKEIGGVSENVVSRNGDLGDRVRFLVNPRAEGTEKFGYLMKKRNEWHEEDQRALAQKNNMIDQAIKRGKITGDNPNFYTPSGSIQLRSELK
jgi:hypothetical protein